MKIKLLSDLHLEFGVRLTEQPYSRYRGEDVLVLAGDIHIGGLDVIRVLDAFRRAGYPHIVYVAGNHEYYSPTPRAAFHKELTEYCLQYPNVHFLDPGVVEINGIRFVGATLYSDFGGDLEAQQSAKKYITDFRNKYNFTPEMCIANYQRDIQFIKEKLAESNMPTYVVTHFLPAYEVIHPRWYSKGDPVAIKLNKYFASDNGEYLKQLKNVTWLCGHTHDNRDLYVGNTRVVANPIGYPNEVTNPCYRKYV